MIELPSGFVSPVRVVDARATPVREGAATRFLLRTFSGRGGRWRFRRRWEASTSTSATTADVNVIKRLFIVADATTK